MISSFIECFTVSQFHSFTVLQFYLAFHLIFIIFVFPDLNDV